MVTEKYRCKDEGPVLGPGALHFVSFLLLIIGPIIAYQFWKRAGQFSDPRLARQIILAGVVVSVLPMLITIFQVVRLRRSIGQAELEIPYPLLPMGFSGTATYIRPLRGGASVRQIEARLQCQEVLITGSGKNKKTRYAIVYDEPVAPTMTPGLQEMRVQVPLRIPASGPASLDFPDLRVEWWVRFRLNMNGCPNTRSSFQLEIWPAVQQ